MTKSETAKILEFVWGSSMTKSETAKILAVLKVAYPKFYANSTQEETAQAVSLWGVMLADYPYEIVSKAVYALIATEKFPPAVSEVIEQVVAITAPKQMDGLEAWNIIRKAVSNSTYNAKQEYSKLPEPLQRLVQSPHMLRDWAGVEIHELQTVVQSNFLRMYKAQQTETQAQAQIPSRVRSAIAQSKAEMLPPAEPTLPQETSYSMPEWEQQALDKIMHLQVDEEFIQELKRRKG